MARGGGPGGFDVNALMKQAQQMQDQMLQAQEQLKDETVEASAGGGMVKVKMGGDLTLREIAIDPEAIDPEEAEMLAEMVQAAVNEGLRAAQELASSKMGGITGGLGGGLGAPGGLSTEGPAPLARLVAELSRLPGIGQRTAQRLAFHLLRAPDEEAFALGDAIREVKEKVGLCEECFNLAEGPLCRICADQNRDRAIDLRGRGAGRRDPDRAHPRIPRPLPRARRRPLADRRRRRRGPEDRRAAAAGRARRRSARSCSPPTRPRPARRPPSTSPSELRGQVAVTRLASGLPVGADLEHADEVTLGKALAGRRSLD